MKRILVVGGGGHAKVVLSILKKHGKYRVLGYTDLREKSPILGVPYLGNDDSIGALWSQQRRPNAVLGVGQIGTGAVRLNLWRRLKPFSLKFPSIVSPAAVVNESVTLGDATVVMDGAVINSGTIVGTGVIVNTNATIEHDVAVSDWVHIAPGCTISGGVTIGRFSLIGAGAIVIQGISIAESCVIGAGAVVVRNLTEGGVYAGIPARRIK